MSCYRFYRAWRHSDGQVLLEDIIIFPSTDWRVIMQVLHTLACERPFRDKTFVYYILTALIHNCLNVIVGKLLTHTSNVIREKAHATNQRRHCVTCHCLRLLSL